MYLDSMTCMQKRASMAHQVDMALNGLDISLHVLHALVKGLDVNLHSLARDAPLEADELQKERAAIDSRSRNSKRGFVLAVLLASAHPPAT